MIEYTIRMFDARSGHLVVDYGEYGFKTLDVPLDENGNFIIGDKLDTFVRGQISQYEIYRREKLKQGVGNAYIIESLVVPLVGVGVGITHNDVKSSTIPTGTTNLDTNITIL